MVAIREEQQEQKVLQFPEQKVAKVYKSFLSLHSKNSKRTAEEYHARVQEFFKMTVGKDIRFVTIQDIDSVEKSDVQIKYIDELVNRKNKYSTIQVKLNSVRSFYNEMLANGLKVNPMIFKVRLPKDGKHHNSLDKDELEMLFDFMKEQKELSTEKYLLCKMLFTTANRKTATMGLSKECGMTWEDNLVIRRDLNTGEDIHVVRIHDKGNKWIEKPISSEFYEELQQINKGQKHVFPFNPRTLSRALEGFSTKIGRKITPHSLKASAITIGYQMTKDIELCRQLGGHSSIVTTEIYLSKEKSLVNQLSYKIGNKVDESLLETLSHRELLDFINANKDIKMSIILRLGKE